MSDDVLYQDIAVLAGDRTDDAWEAMAESYEFLARLLVAVLQTTGKKRIPEDWAELSQGFVVICDPLKDGSLRLQAVRRGEVRSTTNDGARRLREKWERQYRRVDS